MSKMCTALQLSKWAEGLDTGFFVLHGAYKLPRIYFLYARNIHQMNNCIDILMFSDGTCTKWHKNIKIFKTEALTSNPPPKDSQRLPLPGIEDNCPYDWKYSNRKISGMSIMSRSLLTLIKLFVQNKLPSHKYEADFSHSNMLLLTEKLYKKQLHLAVYPPVNDTVPQ